MPYVASHKGYAVYMVTSPSGRRYIGMAKNFEDRRSKHLSAARQGREGGFLRAIRKYGERLRWELHSSGWTREEAEDLEHTLIISYNTCDPRYGYNRTLGGVGCAATPETAEKIRRGLLRSGHKPPSRKGAKMSPESRAKMREAALRRIAREGSPVGRLQTPQARAKRTATLRGRA